MIIHNEIRDTFTGDAMNTTHPQDRQPERRSEERSDTDRYYSVQFTTSGLSSFYQFKLWNISSSGLCILVKEGSDIIDHLNVGDTLDMTYYLTGRQGAQENLKTQIRHITKNDQGRFQGHFLVGLAIVGKAGAAPTQE